MAIARVIPWQGEAFCRLNASVWYVPTSYFVSIRSSRCFNWGSAQLVHNSIHSVHVTCVGLGGVAFRQAFVQLIHSRLVVADSGGDGVDGLLAGSLVGVCSGESNEVGDGVEENELANVSVPF